MLVDAVFVIDTHLEKISDCSNELKTEEKTQLPIQEL